MEDSYGYGDQRVDNEKSVQLGVGFLYLLLTLFLAFALDEQVDSVDLVDKVDYYCELNLAQKLCRHQRITLFIAVLIRAKAYIVARYLKDPANAGDEEVEEANDHQRHGSFVEFELELE